MSKALKILNAERTSLRASVDIHKLVKNYKFAREFLKELRDVERSIDILESYHRGLITSEDYTVVPLGASGIHIPRMGTVDANFRIDELKVLIYQQIDKYITTKVTENEYVVTTTLLIDVVVPKKYNL